MSDPQPTPPDHTVVIVAAVVTLFAILAMLALGLETVKSGETLAILGIVGTAIGATIITQLFKLDDRLRRVAHSVNGEMTERMTEVVRSTVTQILDERQRTDEARIRRIVYEVLDERNVHCQDSGTS